MPDRVDLVTALTQRIAEVFEGSPVPSQKRSYTRVRGRLVTSSEISPMPRTLRPTSSWRGTPTPSQRSHRKGSDTFCRTTCSTRFGIRDPKPPSESFFTCHRPAPTTTIGVPASQCSHLLRRQRFDAFLGFLEKEFEGQAYRPDFARARVIWGCPPSL